MLNSPTVGRGKLVWLGFPSLINRKHSLSLLWDRDKLSKQVQAFNITLILSKKNR